MSGANGAIYQAYLERLWQLANAARWGVDAVSVRSMLALKVHASDGRKLGNPKLYAYARRLVTSVENHGSRPRG